MKRLRFGMALGVGAIGACSAKSDGGEGNIFGNDAEAPPDDGSTPAGQALKVIGDTKYAKLRGVGFRAGTAYGFGATGQLCAIDVTNGAATPIPLTGVPQGLQSWGAGSTTIAPIQPAR
jgi:hypothetical protein